MIANLTTGSDFRGLLKYLLNEEKQPQIVNSNMLENDIDRLTVEFNTVADRRPKVELAVRHISLSFAPDDVVDNTDKASIVDRVMKEMGYEDCQYLAIAHHPDDPGHDLIHEHQHLHIVANAVSVFGDRVSDSWDRLKIQPILREIERDFGLTPVVNSVDRWAQKTVEQQIKPEQSGKELALTIDRAAEEQPDLQTWLDRLQQDNVDVTFTLKKDGTVRGIAYLQGGEAFRGSEIGRTWKSVGEKIAIGSDDVRVMSAANINSQGHRMNMSEVERERFERAVKMSVTALEGRENVKTGRIHLKREDKEIAAYRMHPHKEILKAVETAEGWDAIGQPKIDDKDLELLSKVSGIAGVEEIKSRSTESDRMVNLVNKHNLDLQPWNLYGESIPENMLESYSSGDVSISPDDSLKLAQQQEYSPSAGELHDWFYAAASDRNIVDRIRVVGGELRTAYLMEDSVQDKDSRHIPDNYRSVDVTISMEEKEHFDNMQAQMQHMYSLGR